MPWKSNRAEGCAYLDHMSSDSSAPTIYALVGTGTGRRAIGLLMEAADQRALQPGGSRLERFFSALDEIVAGALPGLGMSVDGLFPESAKERDEARRADETELTATQRAYRDTRRRATGAIRSATGIEVDDTALDGLIDKVVANREWLTAHLDGPNHGQAGRGGGLGGR